MLPSGTLVQVHSMKTERVGDGLYVVAENAYAGSYDFFSPSPLFPNEPYSDNVATRVSSDLDSHAQQK